MTRPKVFSMKRADHGIRITYGKSRQQSMGGSCVARFATIKVGQPLSLEDLRRKPTPRVRRSNPRDKDLAKLVTEVSLGASSQVLSWHFDGKAATAPAAATKVIKASSATVFVSSRPDMPGVLLFSRVPLSGR
jgi:hypothetical protein